MPLYEYECTKCHHRFERIVKFSDPQITTCPDCGGPVEQLISAPAVQFKGSGWYVNDYGKGGSTTRPVSGDGAPKSESASGDASKSSDSSKGSETSAGSSEKAKPSSSKPKSDE